MTSNEMNTLIKNVLGWGHERGLHDTTDLKPQLVKLTEELGEIAAGVARDDADRIMDGVGDLLVVLINFGAVYDKRYGPYDPQTYFVESGLRTAWHQIAARTGKTVNGIFVKDEPNEEEM